MNGKNHYYEISIEGVLTFLKIRWKLILLCALLGIFSSVIYIHNTVREFIIHSPKQLGVSLKFEGIAENEKAIVIDNEGDKALALKLGDVIMQIDPRYYRLTEVQTLLGDPTKAKAVLGWVPDITIDEMIASDLDQAKQHALLKKHGYVVVVGKEN